MKLLLVISILALVSCSPDLPDPQVLVEEIYNSKVQNLRNQKLSSCKEKQIEKANEKVDSIVHKLLNAGLLDTINFPARPVKPTTPEHIIGTVKKFEVDEGRGN